MERAQKETVVTAVRAEFQRATSAIFTDFRGLTVSADTTLRSEFRKAGVRYRVVKNTLVEKAIEGMGLEFLTPFLVGPTGIAWSQEWHGGEPARVNEEALLAASSSIHQALRVVGEGGYVAVGVEDQQVVLLRYQSLVVDFLSNQEQDSAWPATVVSFHALHQHIVIRHDDHIHSGFQCGGGDILMYSTSIGVSGMHMEIHDNFVHR